jgi:Uma2 family endonuclease
MEDEFMATALVQQTTPYGPRDAGVPMTPREFETSDFDENYCYELIHGVLVVTPIPLEQESDANEELGHWLRSYQDFHPQGKSLDLTLPERNVRTRRGVRRADRLIWAGLGRLPVTRGRMSRRDPPTVAVEFTSSRPADQRRDYQEKREEYRDAKVKEYWIVDRFARQMTVYFWRGSRWIRRVVREQETYTTPLLPGFELSLAKLLAVSDKYHGQSADDD